MAHGGSSSRTPERLCAVYAPHLAPVVDALVPRWRRQRLGAREVDRCVRRVVLAAVLAGTDAAHWDCVDARARTWAHVWERVRDAWAARERVLGTRDARDRLAFVRTLARRLPHHAPAAPAAMPALVALPSAQELARLVAAQRGHAGASSASSSSDRDSDSDSDDGAADDNDDEDEDGAASACTTTDIDDVHSCTPGIVMGETPGGTATGDNTPMC